MKACIERTYGPKQTLGELFVYDNEGKLLLKLKTLELPWLENQRRISCIPEGSYQVIRHHSPKFGPCFWVQDVPNRSEILFHQGNYYSQILGCILPGLYHSDINADGLLDVASSRAAMRKMLKLLPDRFTLSIEQK